MKSSTSELGLRYTTIENNEIMKINNGNKMYGVLPKFNIIEFKIYDMKRYGG